METDIYTVLGSMDIRYLREELERRKNLMHAMRNAKTKMLSSILSNEILQIEIRIMDIKQGTAEV